jgi:hypothetical protein
MQGNEEACEHHVAKPEPPPFTTFCVTKLHTLAQTMAVESWRMRNFLMSQRRGGNPNQTWV